MFIIKKCIALLSAIHIIIYSIY